MSATSFLSRSSLSDRNFLFPGASLRPLETVSQLVSKVERHQLHSIHRVSSSARPGQAADSIRDVLSLMRIQD